MLGQLMKQWEARGLNRDAVAIIAADRRAHADEHLRAIANKVREVLTEASAVLESSPHRERDVLTRLREQHRAARRAPSQIDLSAITLVIIHVRSRRLGDAALAAREAIESFVAEHGDPPAPDGP